MRVDRAMSTTDSGSAGEVLDSIREHLPEIVGLTIEAAKAGDDKARSQILGLAEDDIYRARSGQASNVLMALAEVREKGSKINERLWARLVKKVVESTAE